MKYYIVLRKGKNLLEEGITIGEAIIKEDQIGDYSQREDVEIFPMSEAFNEAHPKGLVGEEI